MASLRYLSRIGFCRPSALLGAASCATWTHGPIVMSEEVNRAIRKNQPVVALESTIVTHGMPYPDNLTTVQEVEAVVRDSGAIPATVCIHRGRVHVGVPSEILETLARLGGECAKVSRRDLPVVVSKGLMGGTTVSATVAICHKVGIPIFVTGGVGGVHKCGEFTLDISADLVELGRTPVTVVSAGVKSILDIGRTLEFLETQGVCVVTYGDSREFPAFFTPRSGHQSPWNVEDPRAAASLIASRDALGLKSGIMIAVPVPESSAADGEVVERAVGIASREAEAKGIVGNTVTPYVLKRVSELTGGASLAANVALIKNNAAVGAKIAVALCQRRNSSSTRSTSAGKGNGRPVVVGGSNVDVVARITEDNVELNGSTHKGEVRVSYGGVGRNLADCMTRLLGPRRPRLVSVVGEDDHGDALLRHNAHMDLTGIVQLQNRRTATYIGVLDEAGECRLGIGDMAIHQEITVSQVQRNESHILSAPIVAMDGNIPTETLNYVVSVCEDKKIPVWFEPTDTRKAVGPFLSDTWKGLSYISPNMAELRTIHPLVACGGDESPGATDDASPSAAGEESIIREALRLSSPLMRHLLGVLVTLGSHGALFVGRKDPHSETEAWHCPVAEGANVRSVSGAGDCLAAAVMCAMLAGLDVQEWLSVAMRVAALSVASPHAVPDTVRPSCLSPSDQLLPRPRRVAVPSSVS